MKTVGKQLQDARMAKGWSPEMAARETKIRLDRLRELEDDDYSNFSSPTYARGFVRTYARALGLDEYRVLRQLDNKLPEDDNATFVNDTGVPYMPEPGQVSKPFEVGRGVYIAGGVGAAMLLIIGFILVQSYRAGYFASATPPPAALPVTATNALPAVPDTETARALPADTNAAPVPVPVDLPPAAVATTPPAAATTTAAPAAAAVAAAPTDTNAAPRALPVDLNALAATTNATPAANAAAPVAVATPPAPTATNLAAVPAAPTVPAPVPVAANPPATSTLAPDAAAVPSTVPITTATPPRALPVDLNALGAMDASTNSAPAVPSTNAVAAAPVSAPAPTPAPEQPTPHSLSARDSDTGPGDVHLAAAEKATQDLIAATTPPPVAPAAPAPVASPVVLPSQPAPAVDPAAAPAPAPVNNPPVTDASETGSTASAPPASATPGSGDAFHGKRLVLTASHDSFVRVIALDGPNAGQVRYSSMLHGGQSISFDDRKYSINVGDPSAVDIALDGINYGPHSDDSTPDTFTVESHIP